MSASSTLGVVASEIRQFAKLGLSTRSVAAQAAVLSRCPTLRDLPATRRADTDRPTPRYEYLVQAIVDAVDAIDLRGHTDDAATLRALFGLTEAVRRAEWARRQEVAAGLCGVGRDHFRRNLQEPLLMAVAEVLVGHREEDPPALDAAVLGAVASQDGLMKQTVEQIQRNPGAEALLLELSTATISPVIDALRHHNSPTKLLVANPYVPKSAWQQERSWMTLVNRFQHDFVGHPHIEVRLYGVPPGLRGRLVGDQFALGWYTHRDDPRYDPDDPNASSIWGHDNAMVHGSVSSPSGAILADWFRKEFERLWRHRLTRRGSDVARTLGLQP